MRNRQFELLLYLLKVKKTTHAALASQFEVSVKTIQRDIDQLARLGVPIICQRGSNGGIFIEESYKLNTSFFTPNDLQTITFALSLYDAISVKKQKEQVLQKLALISPDLIQLFEQDAQDYFVVDLMPQPIDLTTPIYKAINHCFDEEQFLEIEYNQHHYTIAPISYVLKADGLYLYAFMDDYYLFKTEHIQTARILNETFERNFIPYDKNTHILFK